MKECQVDFMKSDLKECKNAKEVGLNQGYTETIL